MSTEITSSPGEIKKKESHFRSILRIMAVVAVSILLFQCYTGLDPEALLIDDNRTQWFPVLERAYAELFSTGRLPVYDFFQFKGMSVAEPGYYSIMNPLMLAAYVITHFFTVPFSTITVYIGLLFILGNVVFFRLCMAFRNRFPFAILLTVGYATVASFFSFGYWYYVFNNYLILPLIIYTIVRTRGTKKACWACGAVLAFSLLLGNIQYTVYHYMVYGIIALFYMILDGKAYIKLFFINLLCAVCLSAPFLLLSLRASSFFENQEFSSMQVSVWQMLFGGFYPAGIIGQFSAPENFGFTQLMFRYDNTWLYNGTYAVLWLILFFAGIKHLWARLKAPELQKEIRLDNAARELYVFGRRAVRKARQYHAEKVAGHERPLLIAALAIAIWFFISLTGNGVVARILYYIPVINQFRYLFKGLFVLQPLVCILSACILPLLSPKLKKTILPWMLGLTLVGIVNTCFVTGIVEQLFLDKDSPSLVEEKRIASEAVERYLPDHDRYRSITFLQSYALNPDCFRYYEGYLRNFPTTIGLYSLAGYDIAAPQEHLEQISALYNEKNVSFTQMVGASSLDGLTESAPGLVRDQLKSNGVKYILVETDKGNPVFRLYENRGWEKVTEPDYWTFLHRDVNYLDVAVNYLSEIGIPISKVEQMNEHYALITLSDPAGLCVDEAGEALPLSSKRMDILSFSGNASASYTLSFAYDDRLSAYGETSDGERIAFSIAKTGDGNIRITGTDRFKGRICVIYRDRLCTAAFVMEGVITALLLLLLVLLVLEKKEAYRN
ncbi:MAG: hypothetical protein IKO68_05985 [Oscillospiraceae bacterium]|nr:hypothetical protein [Oscillospiraceae bacterium]